MPKTTSRTTRPYSKADAEEHIEPALRWNDFWRQHGDDPELVALDTRRRSAFDKVVDSEDAKESWR